MNNDYPMALLPFSNLSPSACQALVVALEDATSRFQQWNLNMKMSRLQQAHGVLQRIVERNSYGETPNELLISAKAITLASDFYYIARILQDNSSEPMLRELQLVLEGTLKGNTSNQSPYNFQSQFWVGAVLAFSNVHPTIVLRSGKLPDFTISVDSLQCNVEVKRPQSSKSARKILGAAAAQLFEAGLPNIIALDLSTAIDVDKFIINDTGQNTRHILSERFYTLADELSTIVHNYARSDKFSHTISLFLFARFFSWTIGQAQDADNGFFITMPVLTRAYNGLLFENTVRLQNLIARGLERMSGNPLATRYIRGNE